MVREYFTRDALRQAMAPLVAAETETGGMETGPDPPATTSAPSQPSEVAQDAGSSEGAAPGADDVPATVRYAAQLQALAEMGFTNPVEW